MNLSNKNASEFVLRLFEVDDVIDDVGDHVDHVVGDDDHVDNCVGDDDDDHVDHVDHGVGDDDD